MAPCVRGRFARIIMEMPFHHHRFHHHRIPSLRHSRDFLRDPALWAWLIVALLAIFPAHAVLAGG